MISNSMMDRVISIKVDGTTDKCLEKYLETYPEKKCLYSVVDTKCPDYKLVYIRTEQEFTYFVRKLFKEEIPNTEDDLKNQRVRIIDKNGLFGELETAQLRDAEKRVGNDLLNAYTIEEDDSFIKIYTCLAGTSDVLSELILFSKLKEEDRKRIIENIKERQQKTTIERKKGMAPRR